MKVLVLSASLGDGHHQASEAIRREFLRQRPAADVHVVDYGRFVNPLFWGVTRRFYLNSIRLAPRIYGAFYDCTMAISPDSLVQRRLNTIGLRRLREYLRAQEPDLVVCVYPTAAGVMSRLREMGATDAALATVVTDYAVHSQWLHSVVDMLFVGCEEVRDAIIERGYSPEKVRATGIPIRRMFAGPVDRGCARAALGIPPRARAVLLMGGASGVLSEIDSMPRLLRDLDGDTRVLAVCGRDERLRRRLQAQASRFGHDHMRVFGFVDRVHELMAAADVIVTKAGGLTTTEALVMNLPMIIYSALPGQEEQNARYLAGRGAALEARNLSELHSHLRELLPSESRLAGMRAAARDIARPHAARDMVGTMLDFVRSPTRLQATPA